MVPHHEFTIVLNILERLSRSAGRAYLVTISENVVDLVPHSSLQTTYDPPDEELGLSCYPRRHEFDVNSMCSCFSHDESAYMSCEQMASRGQMNGCTGCPESTWPSRCDRCLTSILISSNIKHNSGRETVTTDFPKENQGVRQALINSDSLRNPLVTIDGERGTEICR
jgi:hypothetical protein